MTLWSSLVHFFKNPQNHKTLLGLYALLVLLVSFCTYFVGYNYPNASQWDEVYHITSAEKYLTGTMFMESHPPLGKMFIALGEKIMNPNKDVNKGEFLKTDQISVYPTNYQFAGVRLFPSLFAAFSGLLFFILLFFLTRNKHLALIFSSLYLFDNALILQSRAAMLDSTQIFFILAALVYFSWQIYLHTKNSEKLDGLEKEEEEKALASRSLTWLNYGILGVLVGLAIAVKHNGAVILLLPFLWLIWEFVSKRLHLDWTVLLDSFYSSFSKNEQKPDQEDLEIRQKSFFKNGLQTALKLLSFAAALILTYCGIFYIHIANGQRVEVGGNNQNGYYQTSGEYKRILDEKAVANPLNFPTLMKDQWNYMQQYHKGVPKLDMCKKDANGNLTENGSYPLTWPVMNRTISFRWEWGSKDDSKPTNNTFIRYSYLIGNPMIWLIGLLAVLLSLILVLGRFIFGLKIENKVEFGWICAFLCLYLGYMFAVLQIDRVMYLYHYLIPLIFSLILACLLFNYRFQKELILNHHEAEEMTARQKKLFDRNRKWLYAYLGFLAILIFGIFMFYSPFTYYQPLSKDEFIMRNWFSFWGMRAAN